MTSKIPRECVYPYIDIKEIKENEDGSATFSVTVDKETFIAFFKIGLLKVISDAVEEVDAIEVD